MKLICSFDDDNISFGVLVVLIGKDLVLMVKVLCLVNLVCYSFLYKIEYLLDVVVVLGMDILCNLSLVVSLCSVFLVVFGLECS